MMTREEAIRRFQRMKNILSIPNSDASRAIEAIDMAIEALTQDSRKVTQESTQDLISRQWLLDLYAIPEDADDVEWKVPLEVVRQNILDAPSADTDMSEYCDRLWKIAYERGKAEAEQYNKDAISREGLLKSWEELSPRGRTEFDQVIMTIPALPSAEAVEVVRCRDCKYWREWENRVGSCHRSENRYNWFGVDSTNYCSFGERREDGEA